MCWHFENDDDYNLLDTMKSIKRNFQGVHFTDVLLSALSISFQNYFESKGNQIPNSMTVVLPARIETEGKKIFFFYFFQQINWLNSLKQINLIKKKKYRRSTETTK